MQFTIESWDPAYGASVDQATLEESTGPVDATVERSLDDWSPIPPDPTMPTPDTIWFVDGVRRIDARVWITDPDSGLTHPGVCATVAAGAVCCEPGSARLAVSDVQRALYTAAPGAGPIVTRHASYGLRPLAGEGNQETYLAVHNHMTAVETALEVPTGPLDVVVFDGPLRGREAATGVGYVKTHDVQYLGDDQQRVVGRLQAGERSPLFLIGGGFARWSWYLRLPGPISHPLSGIVRLELPGMGTADDAIARAEMISRMLPRYASEPHKDTRAPQNLHPIAGLERELRRRLGDPRLLERALRRAGAAAA